MLNGIEGAGTVTEQKLVAFEMLAAGVEKVAAALAIALPKDGWLRKSVELVGNIARKANYDAHLLDNLIHKVLMPPPFSD